LAITHQCENISQLIPNHLGFGINDDDIRSRASFALPRRILNNSEGLRSFPDPNQSDRRLFTSALFIHTISFLNTKNAVAGEYNNHLHSLLISDDTIGTGLLVGASRAGPVTITLPLEPAPEGTFAVSPF
jgi:hypothetical protein